MKPSAIKEGNTQCLKRADAPIHGSASTNTKEDAPDATERRVEVTHVYDQHDAHEVIRRSLLDYRDEFGDPEGALVTSLQTRKTVARQRRRQQ